MYIFHLKIHVCINGHEVALVLATPFELHDYRFTGEVVQEWLWIYRDKL